MKRHANPATYTYTNTLSLILTIALPAFADKGVIRRYPEAAPGQYVVVLEDQDGRNAAAHASSLASEHGDNVFAIYKAAFAGFAIELPEPAALALSRNPKVRSVEENAISRICGLSASQPSGDAENGLWHLDRIDERQVDMADSTAPTGIAAPARA